MAMVNKRFNVITVGQTSPNRGWMCSNVLRLVDEQNNLRHMVILHIGTTHRKATPEIAKGVGIILRSQVANLSERPTNV